VIGADSGHWDKVSAIGAVSVNPRLASHARREFGLNSTPSRVRISSATRRAVHRSVRNPKADGFFSRHPSTRRSWAGVRYGAGPG
jgi:hypothetical protein